MHRIATGISESEIFAIGYAGDQRADSHCVVLDVAADKYVSNISDTVKVIFLAMCVVHG